MASGGPLDRPDFITDDALKAPGIMTEEIQKLIDKLDEGVKKSQEYAGAFTSAESSTTKMKDSTAALTDEQRVLAQVQGQIATLTAKQSDAYIEQVGVLNNLKQSVKDKTALGNQETESVTRENSSRNQLLAALNSNRAAYSNLRSEQERNSPTGKALLKTIQDQDKGFKDLSKSMGDNKVLVGGYKSEIQELIEKFGLVNPEIREAGEKISLFGRVGEAVLSPLGLAIGTIAVGIGITKAALDVFYEDSIQGQDALNSRFNSWKGLLEIVKDSLFDLGKSADSVLGGISDWLAKATAYAFNGAEGVAMLAVKTEKLNAVSELQNDIKKEEIRLVVEVATIELEKSEELYIARDKANQQLEARYEAIQKAKTLTQEDANVKIVALNNEILLQQKLISVNTTKNVVGLTASQIQSQANTLGRVNYEQVKKLAELEAQRLNIQTQTNLGQRRIQGLEATLIDEAIKRQVEFEKAIKNNQEKSIEEGVKADKAGSDRIVQNQVNNWKLRLEQLTQSIADEAVLNDFAKFQAIRAEREKFETITTLTKEQHDAINAEAGGDLEKRAELERNAKSELVQANKQFLQIEESITGEYKNRENAILQKGNADEIKIRKEHAKQVIEIESQLGNQLISTITQVVNDQFTKEAESFQIRLTALDDWHNQELTLAGTNADSKAKIDAEYAQKQKTIQDEQAALKRRQAQFDKDAAEIDIAFKTAIAIMGAVAASPLTGGLPWSAVVAGIGALQLAAVMAKPIPSYEVGTDNHPGGFANVHPGELIQTPSGVLAMTPDRPTTLNLPQGTKVFTNEITRMLAIQGLGVPEKLDRVQKLDKQIVQQLKQTNSLLSRKAPSLIADGLAIIQVQKNQEAMVTRIRSNVMIG